MKKVLFVATVDSHIRHFHIPYLKYFKDRGYEVHVATSDDEKEQFKNCDYKHKISFERSPFKINNLKAINQMFELYKKEQFDIIHCHTPMGSVVARLAFRKYKRNLTRLNRKIGQQNEATENNFPHPTSHISPLIIYTAHGFHFYKGAPILYWLIYYPMEKWLSKYTDKLVLINKEDFEIAKNKFKAKKTYRINGIGVDAEKFNFYMSDEEKKKLKKELSSIKDGFNINQADTVITYVAELINRKNQVLLIEIIKSIIEEQANNNQTNNTYNKVNNKTTAKISDNSNNQDNIKPQNIKVLLVGEGINKDYYQKLIDKYNLNANILLTGYRNDVPKIFKISDICISCAKQEGLPVNLIEGCMSGLPILATNCRGNNEVVIDNKNGYLVDINNKEKFKNKLIKLISNKSIRERLGKSALEESKKYKLSKVMDEMKKIYEE